MTKLTAALIAAVFAAATVTPVAFAAEKGAKKPTAEECKKDPKMAGCETEKKK
jgi:hypothetical protein